MNAGELITEAKQMMAAGDYLGALTRFQQLDLFTLDPLAAVNVMMRMAKSASALGLADTAREYHRDALGRLYASGLVDPSRATEDIVKLALTAAVGARDVKAAQKFLRWLHRAMPPYASSYRISDIIDARDWCRAQGIAVHGIGAEENISLPDGCGGFLDYRTRETWYADIPDAEIVAGWDFVIAPTGEVLTGANYMPLEATFPFMPHGYNPSSHIVAHVWGESAIRIDADAFFLSVPERHHYGHWLSEFMPRLRAWDREESSLAVSASLPPKHLGLLGCFGARADDMIECEIGQRYHFRSLRITPAARADAPHPRDADYLRAALGPPSAARGEHIYFLEREAGTRIPANMTELDTLFQEFGVRKVNPARLTMAEQKDLFANARAIVGAFGTELYCLYHLPAGATVIELHWDVSLATAYGPPCRFIGLDHHLILCAKAETRGAATYRKDGNLIVDCAKLREHLAAL